MGNILYPPHIEGILPAFIKNEDGATIVVPFSMNKAVGKGEYNGFIIKIRTIQTNKLIGEKAYLLLDEDINTTEAKFKIDSNDEIYKNLNKGQFYKIRIAYINGQQNDEELVYQSGYFSTVGIVKCVGNVEVSIENSEESSINFASTYIGKYDFEEDMTEKEYSYRFILKDESNIIFDTKDLIHNSLNDENSYSLDYFTYSNQLDKNKTYTISYQVKTINGLICKTCDYTINNIEYGKIDENIKFLATNDNENGFIDLCVINNKAKENYLNSKFLISRSEDLENWSSIYMYEFNDNIFSEKINYRDFSVEQGKKYYYSLQQYSNDKYSERLLANNGNYISIDFEDIFLSDNERQLIIKYNPKVSTFKRNVTETKVNTLDSKYPFIFRNGASNSVELSISGLISYLTDDNLLFSNGIDFIFDIDDGKRIASFRNDYFNKCVDLYISKYYHEYANWYEELYSYIYCFDENKNAKIDMGENNYKNLIKELQITDALQESTINNIVQVKLDIIKQEQILKNKRLRNTSLTEDTIKTERVFKNEVLEWLTNGKPKLFRSPTEGNYIVGLMNTSLSPQETIGRMLHTFSCSAHEIAEFNYENLQKYNLLCPLILNPNRYQIFEKNFDGETITIDGHEYVKAFSSNDTKDIHSIELNISSESEINRMILVSTGDAIGYNTYLSNGNNFFINTQNWIKEVLVENNSDDLNTNNSKIIYTKTLVD